MMEEPNSCAVVVVDISQNEMAVSQALAFLPVRHIQSLGWLVCMTRVCVDDTKLCHTMNNVATSDILLEKTVIIIATKY